MFLKAMAPIITKAMAYKLYNIHTYKGYDGADILKLTFKDKEELIVVRDFSRALGFKTNTLKENTLTILYCIFEADTDIYSLKED